MKMPELSADVVEFARKLHGHVGPYLVIGLRMGFAAKKALNVLDTESTLLGAEVSVPMYPPFSCLLRWRTSFHNMYNRQPKTPNQKLKNHPSNLYKRK